MSSYARQVFVIDAILEEVTALAENVVTSGPLKATATNPHGIVKPDLEATKRAEKHRRDMEQAARDKAYTAHQERTYGRTFSARRPNDPGPAPDPHATRWV